MFANQTFAWPTGCQGYGLFAEPTNSLPSLPTVYMAYQLFAWLANSMHDLPVVPWCNNCVRSLSTVCLANCPPFPHNCLLKLLEGVREGVGQRRPGTGMMKGGQISAACNASPPTTCCFKQMRKQLEKPKLRKSAQYLVEQRNMRDLPPSSDTWTATALLTFVEKFAALGWGSWERLQTELNYSTPIPIPQIECLAEAVAQVCQETMWTSSLLKAPSCLVLVSIALPIFFACAHALLLCGQLCSLSLSLSLCVCVCVCVCGWLHPIHVYIHLLLALGLICAGL